MDLKLFGAARHGFVHAKQSRIKEAAANARPLKKERA
jgi:hypothetical protein